MICQQPRSNAEGGGPAGPRPVWVCTLVSRLARLAFCSRVRHTLSISLLWWLPLSSCVAGQPDGAELASAWLSASALDFDFKEFDAGGTRLNHEHGSLPGVAAGMKLSGDTAFAEAQVSYYSGAVRYDGQTQSGLPVTTRTDEGIFDGSALAGVHVRLPNGFGSAVFAGAGYRHWNRGIRSTQSAAGLSEIYDWWYALVGVNGSYRASKRMRWTADLRLARPLNPSIRVKFGNALDDKTLKLGEKTGYRLALAWHYSLTGRAGLEISPFYEQWKLGRSATRNLTQNGTPLGTLYEPRSEAKSRGLRIGFGYNF